MLTQVATGLFSTGLLRQEHRVLFSILTQLLPNDFRSTDTIFKQAAFIFAKDSERSVLFSARRGTT